MTEGEYRARWAALGAKPVFKPDRNIKWNERRWKIYNQRQTGSTFEEIAAVYNISVKRTRAIYAFARIYLEDLCEAEARKMRGL